MQKKNEGKKPIRGRLAEKTNARRFEEMVEVNNKTKQRELGKGERKSKK